jgi:hypothetical protein
MPEEVRERLRDPWRGIALLLVGIVLLLAAGVVGACA